MTITINRILKEIKDVIITLWKGGIDGTYCNACEDRAIKSCFQLHHFMVQDYRTNSEYFRSWQNI